MSTQQQTTTGSEIIALLTLQRDLYRRLSELGQSQRTLIADNQPEVLLQTLTERQSLINRLARLNAQLGPYRRTWDATYAGLQADQRTTVNDLLDDINQMLRSILQNDREDTQRLAAQKESAGAALRDVKTHTNATAAYGAPSTASTTIAPDVTG